MAASVDLECRAYVKRSFTQDDLVFLKELQHELNSQPTLATADPRFWVIRDYEYREATDGDDIEAVELFEDGEGEIISLGEAVSRAYKDELDLGGEDHAKEWLEDNWLNLDENGCIQARYTNMGISIAKGVVKEYAENNALGCVFLTRLWAIVPDTMFLTLREAEEHLKANYYHYTTEAHTYCMHAWCSPDVAQLIKLLHTVDFDELTELVSKGCGQ